jgi:AraC family transcriptional regulator
MRDVGPFGPHGIPELWQRLNRWSDAHGLGGPRRTALGIAYDDPSITPADKTRYDACVVVPPDFPSDHLVEASGRARAAMVLDGALLRAPSAWSPAPAPRPAA